MRRVYHALLYELLLRLLQQWLLMGDKAARVAIGGVFSALSLLFMFMSAVVPLASIAAPMLAGTALVVVVTENGPKTAMLVYVSVSLLSVFIVPDLDAKLLFIMFFGYYTPLRPRLERVTPRFKRVAAKLIVFNLAQLCWYLVSTRILGVDEALSDSGFFAEYGVPIIFLGMNVNFFCYDYMLRRLTRVYAFWFRPRFLKR